MTFELLFYRRKWSAVTRATPGGVIEWYSRSYSTEDEVRIAIKKLTDANWGAVEVVISKY